MQTFLIIMFLIAVITIPVVALVAMRRFPGEYRSDRDEELSRTLDATLHDLTKPLGRFADDDPRIAERLPERTVTCHGCRGAKTQACGAPGCGPACETCMGYRRVACGVCHGLGHVTTLASPNSGPSARQSGR